MTTPLGHILVEEINKNGPITFYNFMKTALTHPVHGYYTSNKAIGSEGDFITAPEISQMFGELCGLWGLDQLITQNVSQAAGWVELGPGRGTFMADIIRACNAALQEKTVKWPVHLIDINKELIKEQKAKLKSIAQLQHHQNINALPQIPLLFVANEFFDALPIRSFQSINHQWFEKIVCLENDVLTHGLHSSAETEIELPKPTSDHDVAEYAPELSDLIETISKHINLYGGAALIIDYGKDNAIGDSVQAVMDHKPVDILESPGLCDLSAWVDFSAIKKIALKAGSKVFGPQAQGEFLKQLGLYQRAEQLAVAASSEDKRHIVAAVDRLSSPAQMGNVFKVMAILPASHPIDTPDDLAGFALPG